MQLSHARLVPLLLLFALALATKESVVVLPAALLLLLQGIDVRRPFRWRVALRAVAPHLIVLAVATALFAASPVYGRMMDRSAGLRSPWVLGHPAGSVVRGG